MGRRGTPDGCMHTHVPSGRDLISAIESRGPGGGACIGALHGAASRHEDRGRVSAAARVSTRRSAIPKGWEQLGGRAATGGEETRIRASQACPVGAEPRWHVRALDGDTCHGLARRGDGGTTSSQEVVSSAGSGASSM